jgi:hypothetical protein
MGTGDMSLLVSLTEFCTALDSVDDGDEPLAKPIFNGLLSLVVQVEILQPIGCSVAAHAEEDE